MGILGSRYSRDFGDPSVIIGTPWLQVHGASSTGGTGSVLKTCQMQDGSAESPVPPHQCKALYFWKMMGEQHEALTGNNWVILSSFGKEDSKYSGKFHPLLTHQLAHADLQESSDKHGEPDPELVVAVEFALHVALGDDPHTVHFCTFILATAEFTAGYPHSP